MLPQRCPDTRTLVCNPSGSPLRTASLTLVLSLAGLAPAFAQQHAPVPAVNTASRAQVLAVYRHYYLPAARAVPTWTGSVAARNPGTVGDDFLCATLQRVNYFRAMSGLRGDVVFDPARNACCQQAALMMAAERNVSHHPSAFWKGYTPAAAEASAHSDLCMNWDADQGPGAVDRYMADDEPNNACVGHRRWLLCPQTAVMGAGIVPAEGREHPGANAIWIGAPAVSALLPVANPAPGTRLPTAWPPPGFVPAPLVYTRWSFSYANADFHAATVAVTKNGVALPIARERLEYQTATDGAGSGMGPNTLVWTLPGNLVRPNADESYQVRVSNVLVNGARRNFTYPVVSIDPAASPAQDSLLVWNDLAPGTDPSVVSVMAALPVLPALPMTPRR